MSDGRQIGSTFEAVTDPAVSDDGRVVAFVADGEKPTLFVGARQIPIDERLPVSVFLNRDGSAWGLVSRSSVTTAEGKSEAFDEVRGGEFSPAANDVVFAGRKGTTWRVVAAGKKYEAPGLVSDPVWNKDGTRIGYGAILGRELWWKVLVLR
jgi:hypothetical protein